LFGKQKIKNNARNERHKNIQKEIFVYIAEYQDFTD